MIGMSESLHASGDEAAETRLVGGRYQLVERLGRGGMGTVWRAVDERMRRQVAVKEPFAPAGLDPAAVPGLHRRMLREAQAAAAISHPHVVRVHDIETVDGCPWLVMELIEGESLADHLAEGTLGVSAAARIGAQIADALAAAHAAGVVHRDVKPGNIMLAAATGQALLTDFGIARIEGQEDLTRTGQLVGSLPYFAPERAAGRRAGPAADLWALGLVLHEAVEGVHPFRRSTPEATLVAIVQDPVPEARRAGRLAPVLGRLLARDPEQRPDAATARELLRAAAEEARPAEAATVQAAVLPIQVPTPVPTLLPTLVMPPSAVADGLPPGPAPGSAPAAAPALPPTRFRRLLSSWPGRAVLLAVGATAVGAGLLTSYLTDGSTPGPTRVPPGYAAYRVSALEVGIAVPADYLPRTGGTRAHWSSPDGTTDIKVELSSSGGRTAQQFAAARTGYLDADAAKVGDCVSGTTGMGSLRWDLVDAPQDPADLAYSFITTDGLFNCSSGQRRDEAMEHYVVVGSRLYTVTFTFQGYDGNSSDDLAVYRNVVASLAFGG
jgi:hypothetical protein